MSEAPSPGELTRLAARTRELVLDLEASRADVLSVADLNRALRQVLRNQVAIIEALAGSQAPRPDGALAIVARQPDGPSASASSPAAPVTAPSPMAPSPMPPAPVAPAPVAAGSGTAGAVAAAHSGALARPADLAGSGAQARRVAEPLVFEPDEVSVPAVPALNGTNGAAKLEAPAPGPAGEGEAQGDESAPAQGASVAEQVLREVRVLPVHVARSVVEAFDNRDKNYDKGLEKLNRWVAGGTGTPFQWRGDRAYLNPNGAGAAAIKNYEEQLMSRMGFSRRLGRLVVPGLQGEVIIYERPG